MEGQPGSMKWKSSGFGFPRLNNRDICLPTRLGAFCNKVSMGGQCSQGESLLHINCLELLAGAFAVKTFEKGKAQMGVRLLLDNLTATHYINKMEGTNSLVLARLAPQYPHRGSVFTRGTQYLSRLRI